jgi:hypothetical protein
VTQSISELRVYLIYLLNPLFQYTLAKDIIPTIRRRNENGCQNEDSQNGKGKYRSKERLRDKRRPIKKDIYISGS